MKYTELLKTAADTFINKLPKKGFWHSMAHNPFSPNRVFNIALSYDAFVNPMKGNFSNVKFAASPAYMKAMEEAGKALQKSKSPIGFLGAAGQVAKGILGASALGATGYYLYHTVKPNLTTYDIDELIRKAKEIEPQISTYPDGRIKNYTEIILEHSPELAHKPRIFSAILVKLLPYPTFPYEMLNTIEKAIPTYSRAKTIADTSRGLEAVSRMLP